MSEPATPGGSGASGAAGQSDDKGWLYRPGNATRLVYVLYVVCFALLASDVFFPKHGRFLIEHAFGFYAIFGFFAGVVVILVSKILRRIVMRPEDYYDR